MELCLHGDVGEDEPQREGTLPGASAAREATLDESAVGQQEVEVAKAAREAKGQVRGHVRRTGVATRDGAAVAVFTNWKRWRASTAELGCRFLLPSLTLPYFFYAVSDDANCMRPVM